MASLRLELPAPVTGRVGALDELRGVAILLVIDPAPSSAFTGNASSE